MVIPNGTTHKFDKSKYAAQVDDDELNSIEIGGSVFEVDGLEIGVTALTYWDTTGAAPAFATYAGASGGLFLAGSDTNYIYLNSSGAIQINQSGFPDPGITNHIPLAEADTDTNGVTAWRDRRPKMVIGPGASGVGSVSLLANDDWDTSTNSLAVGEVAYVSGNKIVDKAIADGLAAGTEIVAGVVVDTSKLAYFGRVNIVLDDASPPSPNDRLFLSASTAGRATTTAPSGSGQYQSEIGIVASNSGYASPGDTVLAILQPKLPILRT